MPTLITIFIFYFSAAKETAYYSAQETCEKDSAAIREFEDESFQLKAEIRRAEESRVSYSVELSHIENHPELLRDWAIIENEEEELDRIVMKKKAEIAHLKSAFAKKKDGFSHNITTALNSKVEEIGKLSEELRKECEKALSYGETIDQNERIKNQRHVALTEARTFAGRLSRTIGSNGKGRGQECALERNMMSLDTLRKRFKEGADKGFPNEKDPLSRLFDRNAKIMLARVVFMILRYLKNIGWDRSNSYSGDRIIATYMHINITFGPGKTERRRERSDEVNLRIQKTIFGDCLPAIGQEMVKGFAAEEEQIAKFNAEEEGKKKKELAALPSSTQKRSLIEICSLTDNLMEQANKFCSRVQSAKKRKRTGTEYALEEYNSPGGMNLPYVYTTPKKLQKNPRYDDQDAHDGYGISPLTD